MSNPTKIDYPRRHLRFGWRGFFVFAGMGLVLETLHGFKVRAYLDLNNETRRLMWTLAHAHGTLLSLMNIVFALTLKLFPEIQLKNERAASNCLIGATVLLPGGFFLGGIAFYNGDPGMGVLIVPLGAGLLLVAIFLIVLGERAAKLPSKNPGR